jgi:hypothetical protein
MAVVKRTQVINKPVDVVFQTVVDVANFPNWNPGTPSARKLSNGEIGNGTRFELEIRGLGKVQQELREFDRNKLVPNSKLMSGGHRFVFTAEGAKTRIDHELEMTPKGVFKIFIPLMGMMGKKNLLDLANALQRYLERWIWCFRDSAPPLLSCGSCRMPSACLEMRWEHIQPFNPHLAHAMTTSFGNHPHKTNSSCEET